MNVRRERTRTPSKTDGSCGLANTNSCVYFSWKYVYILYLNTNTYITNSLFTRRTYSMYSNRRTISTLYLLRYVDANVRLTVLLLLRQCMTPAKCDRLSIVQSFLQ